MKSVLTGCRLFLIANIYLFLSPEPAAGEFYSQTATKVSRNTILKEVQNITQQQCLHRCRLNPLCKDIAVVEEEGVCFLMKEGSGNGEMVQVKRMSNTSILVMQGESTSRKL